MLSPPQILKIFVTLTLSTPLSHSSLTVSKVLHFISKTLEIVKVLLQRKAFSCKIDFVEIMCPAFNLIAEKIAASSLMKFPPFSVEKVTTIFG